MSTSLRVLLIEDSEDDAALIARELRAGGFALETERVQTREALQSALDSQSWDLALIDYSLPGFGGTEALQLLREANPAAELLTGIRLEQWRGREFGELWPNAKAEGITEAFLTPMRTGVAYKSEDVSYADGRVRGHYRVRTFAMPGDRLGVAFEDVTDRIRAEAALEADREAARHFGEQLAELVVLTNKLSAADSVDQLCRQAVELGRERLGFDRLGLWLLTEEPLVIAGTHGTDEEGRTRDERSRRVTVRSGSVMWRVLQGGERWVHQECTALFNDRAEKVGEGDHVVAGLWDGHRLIGCLTGDNLLGGHPLKQPDCRLLALYGSALGHLCTRQRAEEALRRRSRELTSLGASSRAIAGSLNLGDVMGEIARQARSVLEASHASIVLVEEEGTLAETFDDFADAPPLNLRARPGGATAEILRTARPVVFDDVNRGFDHNPAIRKAGIRSYVGVPLLVEGRTAGVLFLHNTEPTRFSERLELISAFANHAAVALDNARMYEQLAAANERLTGLSQQLVEVQESERSNLARELHDQIGQSITAIKVTLESIKLMPQAQSLETDLDECLDVTDQTLQQIRGLSLDLRPPMLDDLGLAPGIRWFARRMADRAGFSLDVVSEPEEMELPRPLESTCYRIAQEALTNIARHANAQNVEIRLALGDATLGLTIADDGTGFDLAAARTRGQHGEALGLVSMQERAGLVGGRVELESEPGTGTSVRVTLPLAGR